MLFENTYPETVLYQSIPLDVPETSSNVLYGMNDNWLLLYYSNDYYEPVLYDN